MSGLNFRQAAVLTGVDEASLRRWLAADFNEAKAQSIKNVAAMVYNQAVGERDPATKEWVVRPHFGSQCFYLKCQGGWKETTGIVFEDGKLNDDNADRLRAMIEARFKRLADMRKKRATKGTPGQAAEPQAPAAPPEAGNGPAVPG
jgi:hypothetical protein